MSHLFRGRLVLDSELNLLSLPTLLEADLLKAPPPIACLEAALKRLLAEYPKETVAYMLREAGMGGFSAPLAQSVIESMRPQALRKKLRDELGENPFQPRDIGAGIMEKYAPLGVLAHVAAGNMPGIAALSALEGLMTGNINLIKPPGNDGGFTARLFGKLAQIEPRLSPYLYVLDIPSTETERMRHLLSLADGVAVWGSDEAVAGVRALAPPKTQLIEWGHRFSFAYIAPDAATDESLEGIARDVCETDQLVCSAPQCVIFGTEDAMRLEALAGQFARAMERVSPMYPPARRELPTQAEIAVAVQTARALEAAGRCKVFSGTDGEWHLILDPDAKELRATPLYRTVFVCGMAEGRLAQVLRPHRGHLQTVGLAARGEERVRLSEVFLALGVARVTVPGNMSRGGIGDPRDGQSALRRYVRRVSFDNKAE